MLANDAQQMRQLLALFAIEGGQHIFFHLVRDLAKLVDQRLRLVGQVQPPHAAIGRIGPPLDQARLGHAVDHAAQGDPLDIE